MRPGGTRMGPGGPGGTHKDLDGLRWKNMGAGCMSPGPSALLSAMSCDTVGLCGNCDKHGGSESGPSENCDSVYWQRQQSSVQVREPETGVEK